MSNVRNSGGGGDFREWKPNLRAGFEWEKTRQFRGEVWYKLYQTSRAGVHFYHMCHSQLHALSLLGLLTFIETVYSQCISLLFIVRLIVFCYYFSINYLVVGDDRSIDFCWCIPCRACTKCTCIQY